MYYELAPGPIYFCLQNYASLFGGNKICTKIDLLSGSIVKFKTLAMYCISCEFVVEPQHPEYHGFS